MKILLTGGLGYIGSHIAHILGKKAVIIDNKINSSLNYKKHLPHAAVYKTDLNYKSACKVFSDHKIEGVVHLAALKAVNQSVNDPLSYYDNNVISSINLLQAMHKYKINKLIFSSSATVYGNKNKSPLKEDMILSSNNPYGSTKIITEQLISDYANSNKNFKSLSLRYFNPLGADTKTGLSDQPLGKPLNLMPILVDAASKKKIFKVFGDDYDTNDGSCVRDYIHVKDLAIAHILAFKKLNKIKRHMPINLGLGKGISVLEIINLFQEINKVKVNFKITKRRAGDAAITYADITRAKTILKWSPKYSYKDMVRDSWIAHQKK